MMNILLQIHSELYPNMKWVTFDSIDCTGSGINGVICNIFGSLGIDEIVRENTGRYKIYWE